MACRAPFPRARRGCSRGRGGGRRVPAAAVTPSETAGARSCLRAHVDRVDRRHHRFERARRDFGHRRQPPCVGRLVGAQRLGRSRTGVRDRERRTRPRRVRPRGRGGGRLGGHRGGSGPSRRAPPPSTWPTSGTTRSRGARCRCTGSPSRSWIRLPLPGPPQTLDGVATLNLTYPDGPHDAEALLVDPNTGDLFVVTKDLVGGVAQVFRAPANLASGSTTALTQVATVSLGAGQGVTGADVTPAGDVVALRTYLSRRAVPATGRAVAGAGVHPRVVRRERAALRERDTRLGAPGRGDRVHPRRPGLRDGERGRSSRPPPVPRSLTAWGGADEAPAVHRRVGGHRDRVVHVVDDRPSGAVEVDRAARRRRTGRARRRRW